MKRPKCAIHNKKILQVYFMSFKLLEQSLLQLMGPWLHVYAVVKINQGETNVCGESDAFMNRRSCPGITPERITRKNTPSAINTESNVLL